MKNTFFWTLIVAGVVYVLWFQFGQQQQPVELPAGSDALENSRTVPHDRPLAALPPQPAKPAPTFGGYPCNGDCSEDKAGFRWAEQNGISDPDACTGSSGAFIEGCRVYARQRAAELQKN